MWVHTVQMRLWQSTREGECSSYWLVHFHFPQGRVNAAVIGWFTFNGISNQLVAHESQAEVILQVMSTGGNGSTLGLTCFSLGAGCIVRLHQTQTNFHQNCVTVIIISNRYHNDQIQDLYHPHTHYSCSSSQLNKTISPGPISSPWWWSIPLWSRSPIQSWSWPPSRPPSPIPSFSSSITQRKQNFHQNCVRPDTTAAALWARCGKNGFNAKNHFLEGCLKHRKKLGNVWIPNPNSKSHLFADCLWLTPRPFWVVVSGSFVFFWDVELNITLYHHRFELNFAWIMKFGSTNLGGEWS